MDELLERLPLVYGVLAVVVVLLPVARARRLGGAGLAVLALGAAAGAVGGANAPASFVTINEILAGVGIVVILTSLALALRSRGPVAETAAPVARPGHPGFDALLLVGLGLALVAPHLLLVGLGVGLATAAAVRGTVRSGGRLWLIPLIAGAGLFTSGLLVTLTILGPVGGRLATLSGGPFSPSAERLLVLLVGGGALLLAGLPPLTRAPWRLALAPLSAVLLVRVIVGGQPLGLVEWQPLAMFLLVIMFAAAAVTRRGAAMAVAGGLATLWSGDPQGVWAGCVLVLWGWLMDQAKTIQAARGISASARWAGVPAVVPALMALPALEAALRVEVVLSTLAAFSAGLGLALGVRRRAKA